jgi:hypothetical protein
VRDSGTPRLSQHTALQLKLLSVSAFSLSNSPSLLAFLHLENVVPTALGAHFSSAPTFIRFIKLPNFTVACQTVTLIVTYAWQFYTLYLVGVATGYGLDNQRVRIRVPVG